MADHRIFFSLVRNALAHDRLGVATQALGAMAEVRACVCVVAAMFMRVWIDQGGKERSGKGKIAVLRVCA